MHRGWSLGWQYTGRALEIDETTGVLNYRNGTQKFVIICDPQKWDLLIDDAPLDAGLQIPQQGRLLVLKYTDEGGTTKREKIGYYPLQNARLAESDPCPARPDKLTRFVNWIYADLAHLKRSGMRPG